MHHPTYKIGHTTAFVTLVIKPLVRISMYVCVYSVLFLYLLSCNHDISVGVYAMLLVVLMLIIMEERKEIFYLWMHTT